MQSGGHWKLDNLRPGCRKLASLHTAGRVVEAGVEGVQSKRPETPERRVEGVNQPVSVLELNGHFAHNCRLLSHSTKRHNSSPPEAIRRDDSANISRAIKRLDSVDLMNVVTA